MNQPTVETYRDEFHLAFKHLNREWIEHYFGMEAMDHKQLDNPQQTILQIGGEIFVATLDGAAVGVCALVPHGPRSFELAKMAVSGTCRGQGIGDLLMRAAITWARAKSAEEITLLSNTVLEPAITLYKKHGFKTVHLGPHPDYARSNIEMTLRL